MGRDLTQRVQQQAQVQTGSDQTPRTIASMLNQMVPEIQRALPKHMDGDRIARLAMTVLRKDPNLAQCSPESFMGALLTAAQLGLEPGASGEAYLVAYKRECTLIIGYQGYAKLFWQHPLAKHLDAQAVYERDEFDYEYGLTPFLRHKPAMGDRGDVIAYYAVATLTSGASAFVVLSPVDVRRLRGGKSGSNGGIADPMHWMEKKTAVRQLVKLLPKSTELARAEDWDEKVRTDLREDAIDAPPADNPRVIEQTAAGAVDTATGELQDPPADLGADWPDVQQPGGAR
jgi:recombination protein RecT